MRRPDSKKKAREPGASLESIFPRAAHEDSAGRWFTDNARRLGNRVGDLAEAVLARHETYRSADNESTAVREAFEQLAARAGEFCGAGTREVVGLPRYVVAYRSPAAAFVGSTALLHGATTDARSLLDATLASLEQVTGPHPVPCTLGFITDAEIEVRKVIEILTTLLAMNVESAVWDLLRTHGTKRVIFCILLNARLGNSNCESTRA